MKYVIIIPDGCADEPQDSLGGKTPLQAADLPNMQALARTGIVGQTDNVPPSLTAASDVATLSLFGYDPLDVYTGRAPLESVAMGLKLGPNDWAIRCNLVTVQDGNMHDFTAGHIGNQDGISLIRSLNQDLGGPVTGTAKDRLEFHAGVSYRNILVYRGEKSAPFSSETTTQAPHDVPDQPIQDHLPTGPGSELLRDLMDRSRTLFAQHPVNQGRRAKAATQIWLWGQGRAPQLRLFQDVYGKTGAIISAVDLVRGVGMLIGWKRIDVPGTTGYLDTDYAAKGRAGSAALEDVDLVCIHIEAPDEASHEGRCEAKIEALEEIDKHIIGPVLRALSKYDAWRILVSPDHRTYLRTKAHAHGAVPFVVAGTGIAAKGQASYDEVTAGKSSLCFEKGHELMHWFLHEN